MAIVHFSSELAQHTGTARARALREVIGQTQQRVAAHQRESHGLGGIGRHADLVERLDGSAGHGADERRQDCRVAGTPAAHEHAIDLR